MNVNALMSAIAANRKQFFDLVEAVENQTGGKIDETELQATIDAEFAGCDSISDEQAESLLMLVSRPARPGART